jgi:hypothetical protein
MVQITCSAPPPLLLYMYEYNLYPSPWSLPSNNLSRQDSMIYRGKGFLAVMRFGSTPTLLPLIPVSKLPLFRSLPVCHRSSLLTGEGGRGCAWSRIILPQESLALYKSFTLNLSLPASCIDARSLTSRSACRNRTFGCGLWGPRLPYGRRFSRIWWLPKKGIGGVLLIPVL